MISVDQIDALLPQTQCGECKFSGCRPYAEALTQGNAPIDRCPPGGVDTVVKLAAVLKVDALPYLESARLNTRPPSIAVIREEECIGCTKCIQACPVDAIIGSGKLMHSVINHECTGCGLCVEPCPVDCIEMIELDTPNYEKDLARNRYNSKQVRLLREEHEKQQAYREKRKLAKEQSTLQDKTAKQAFILEALARNKAKKINE